MQQVGYFFLIKCAPVFMSSRHLPIHTRDYLSGGEHVQTGCLRFVIQMKPIKEVGWGTRGHVLSVHTM